MQAISDEVRKCVVFLAFKNEDGFNLAGTAFFVSVKLDGLEKWVTYLVTAKHVLVKIKQDGTDGKFYVKINRKDGGEAVYVDGDMNLWEYHDDSSVDVAILPWTPPHDTFDYKNLPMTLAVTDEVIKEEEMGAGDEVFLTGLFSSHHGKKRNLPIIRTGNLALMPEEKVYTNSFGDIDAYLIEARSIGGLSGSPVFAYLGNMRAVKGEIRVGQGSRLIALLGVMHGHWDIDEDAIDSDATGIVGKSVNMGIGIVVPATKILDILSKEEFVKRRKEVEKKLKSQKAPVEDSLQGLSKEKFEDTLKKVSRKTNPEKPDPSKPKT